MRRRPHGLSYAEHLWVGELLWQARTTLLTATISLDDLYPRSTIPRALSHLYLEVDQVRCAAEDYLFCAYQKTPHASLRVYYPGQGLVAWIDQHPRPARDFASPRCALRHRWNRHRYVAELLFQSRGMLTVAWGLILTGYRVRDPIQQHLERLIVGPRGIGMAQVWCQDRMHDALRQRWFAHPADYQCDIFTADRGQFVPWHRRYGRGRSLEQFLEQEPVHKLAVAHSRRVQGGRDA